MLSCDVGRGCSSDLALLWLWYRPAATVLIQLLAWEPPYASGVALKRHKDQKKKKKKTKNNITLSYLYSFYIFFLFFVCHLLFSFSFSFSRAAPEAYGGSQARGLMEAIAASLRQSHSNAGSEPHLQSTP